MRDFIVKCYKDGKLKDTIYHVDSIVFDEEWDDIRIYSWGLVTTLKNPPKWRLSISKNKKVVEDAK